MAQTTGFSIESLRVYLASAYIQFLPPLRVAWRLWQILFRKLVGDQAAETMSVVLRRLDRQKQKCDAKGKGAPVTCGNEVWDQWRVVEAKQIAGETRGLLPLHSNRLLPIAEERDRFFLLFRPALCN